MSIRFGAPVIPTRTQWRGMTPVERVFAKSEPEPNSGCWLYLGVLNIHGYGRIHLGRRLVAAHRLVLAYKISRPIPAGMLACHTCDTPCCVNPDHLFVGSPRDNNADAMRKGRMGQPLKCRRGHLFTPENTYLRPTGKRLCKACVRVREVDAGRVRVFAREVAS